MDSALIVSGSDKSRAALAELVGLCGVSSQTGARSGAEARRLLADHAFDLVVINTPLPDEFGTELAVTASEGLSGILLIVKAENADEISEKVESFGVFVVEKPISRQLFFRTLRLADVGLRRMQGLQQENLGLKNKIEEIRMVDRAKCLLIQFEEYTEADAHRYIEKAAMNQRVSRRQVAAEILARYEHL
jgi:response regulator NasT